MKFWSWIKLAAQSGKFACGSKDANAYRFIEPPFSGGCRQIGYPHYEQRPKEADRSKAPRKIFQAGSPSRSGNEKPARVGAAVSRHREKLRGGPNQGG